MKNTKKSILLIAMAGLLLTVAVSGTLAYLVDVTGDVVNTFEPSEVKCAVVEGEFTPNESITKTDVKIENTGDTTAYIRAAIVVTWQDGQGNVYGMPPAKGTDYSIEINGNDWNEEGGFFYYKHSVPAEDDSTTTDVREDRTTNLINTCTVLTPAPDGDYSLHVEILAQAIQAEGVTNATDHLDVWTNAQTYGK